jgi:POT family proton-dependent oligopeptide transporter
LGNHLNTTLVVAFLLFLRRKKEPSTPTKIAFGLLISALSVLVMAAAVHIGNNGAEKSIVWLVSELRSDNYRRIISAMGLSLYQNYRPKLPH